MSRWNILNALKGIGGEFEVQRVLGAVGTLAYVVFVPTFVATGARSKAGGDTTR